MYMQWQHSFYLMRGHAPTLTLTLQFMFCGKPLVQHHPVEFRLKPGLRKSTRDISHRASYPKCFVRQVAAWTFASATCAAGTISGRIRPLMDTVGMTNTKCHVFPDSIVCGVSHCSKVRVTGALCSKSSVWWCMCISRRSLTLACDGIGVGGSWVTQAATQLELEVKFMLFATATSL